MKFKALNAFTSVHKDYTNPLIKLTQELISIGKTGRSYYKGHNLQKQFNGMK